MKPVIPKRLHGSTSTRGECLDRAWKFLSYRDHGKSELVLKLKEKGFNQVDIDEVVNYLDSKGYLNDYQYARNLVQGRLARKPCGRRYLESQLIARAIPRELCLRVLDELLPLHREVEVALSCLRQLQKGSVESDWPKLYRKLQYLGFTPDTIRQVVSMSSD